MANKAAEELWGYSAKAIKNTNLTLMMPERFREMHTNGLNNYVNTGVSRIINRRVEVVGLHANGFEFPMDLFISETLIDNKINFTAAVRNITKRKKERQLLLDSKKSTEVMLAEKTKKLMDAQMLLIQSEKQETIGILAAGVAHEVKNPLAIIQLGIDYLRQVIKSSPEKTETLDDMNDAVKRADSVIKELMDFSAARNLKKESVNMRMVVDESIRLTSHELVKSKIKTDVIFSDNDVTINIDKQKIIQVLINIIMNSIHAMGENDGVIKFRGKIMKGEGVDFDISASRLQKGPLFILMIEDTGPGVEKDKLDKISEPFYTSKKSGEGTGLGLAITENIIQLHNAKIVLYNVEDGGFGVKLIFNMYPGEYYENT
jgi:PAS domain S-box-containing protein